MGDRLEELLSKLHGASRPGATRRFGCYVIHDPPWWSRRIWVAGRGRWPRPDRVLTFSVQGPGLSWPKSVELDPSREFWFGRGPLCHFQFHEPRGSTSRLHFTVLAIGESYWLTNYAPAGTILNGGDVRIGHWLKSGDEIRAGNFEITVHIGPLPPPRPFPRQPADAPSAQQIVEGGAILFCRRCGQRDGFAGTWVRNWFEDVGLTLTDEALPRLWDLAPPCGGCGSTSRDRHPDDTIEPATHHG